MELGNESADLEQRRREAEAIYGVADDENDEEWEALFEESQTYTITKLTQGVRDPNRVNVFLDGNFAFSLDISQVVELDVKVKQKVNPERLKELQSASEFGKLYQRTLEWALTRPHSIRETRDYLKRRKIKRKLLNKQRERDAKRPLPELQDETMSLVVERMIEKHYLDDLKFAKYYVENRQIRRGISQKKLKLELKKKGVSEGDIKRALAEVERPESDEIQKVIKKKRAKYNDFMLVRYLVRQGFDFSEAQNAVENYKPDEAS